MRPQYRPSLPLRLWLTSVVLLAGTVSSVHSQTPAQPPNPELDRAIKLVREGETEKARELFKRAVKKNKLDGEAWYYLGITNLQLSDFKKAAEAFKTAIKVRPDLAAPAHAGYAYSLVLRNKLQDAVREADKALTIDPKNVEALYTLAIVDLRRGEQDEAVKKADAVIALKPDFAAAHLLKSQAYVSYTGGLVYARSSDPNDRQLRYKSAADALEKYLQFETNPRAAQAWKEQLETLKFHIVDPSNKREIYTGREVTTKARLLTKPEPHYTKAARNEQVVGTVVLRCVFAADGTVKHILVVQSLPKGLTEQAVAAARQIQFVPATRDGKPVSMWMQLEYNFNLY